MPQPKTLLVVANPYAALDAAGNPAGLVPKDPSTSRDGSHVGATRRITSVEKVAKNELRSPNVTTEITFSSEPVEVPSTEYYRRKIRRGELLAADQSTATAANLEKFVPPAKALAAAKKAAVDDYIATHGELPACANDTPAPEAPVATGEQG